MAEKKKSLGGRILKAFLILLFILIVIAAGAGFYVYKTVNNAGEYADRFNENYEDEMAVYADTPFKDFIFYDKEEHIFEYEVPAVLLYRYLNIDSMSELLSLPEDFRITKIGLSPDTENKKIDVYLNVSYKDLINTCLIVKTKYMLSEDQKRIELRYEDFYLINDRITQLAKEKLNIALEEGKLIDTQKFPSFVTYYQMPEFMPEYVYDVSCDGTSVKAKYDIVKALQWFISEGGERRTMEEKLDGIWLAVREAGIRHN
jgi:hypothetical protein